MMESAQIQTRIATETSAIHSSEAPLPAESSSPSATPQMTRAAIRTSLKASTLDGVFAAIFSNVTGGVLLSNFLVELKASPIEIGLLAAIPMLVNLIQPLGAYLGDRTTSRRHYCRWVYGSSRLLWLILIAGIGLNLWRQDSTHDLVFWTLGIVLVSHVLGALGNASWLSWMAMLVPRRLRGRYFGIRNSAASFTNLISVPLMGVLVSHWSGGSLQGYGVLLLIGVMFGLLSLGFQFWMMDVNPQVQNTVIPHTQQQPPELNPADALKLAQEAPLGIPVQENAPFYVEIFKNTNFLTFLLYFSVWMFAVNLSAPFFNIYMLDTLHLDISYVTLYCSLHAGAYLLMLLGWGKLADRIGNCSILMLIGVLVALTPLLWLGTGATPLNLWLWLPLLHLLAGGTWAAIDLCINNLQLDIAPTRHQSSYFAIAAAMAGVSGALGTMTGGWLAQLPQYGGFLGLFALSGVLRLVALMPLFFVQESRRRSLSQMGQALLPKYWQTRLKQV